MSLSHIIGFIVVGYTLLFVELFMPGGILGLLGGMLILAGVIGAGYTYGMGVGLPLGFGCAVGGIIIFLLWLRYFPSSRMGRQFSLAKEISKEDGYTAQDLSQTALVGKTGVALTDLRPSGAVQVAERRLDVVSEGAFVVKDAPVVVVAVDSNRIVVRLSDAEGEEEAPA
jgi:membrane-bound serine protease (ClpP class)